MAVLPRKGHPFGWRRALLGAGLGAAVGAVATALGAGLLWLLLVPLGFLLAGYSAAGKPPVLW